MLSRKYEAKLYVMPANNEMGYKVVNEAKLFRQLSEMDDFTRAITIREMNEKAGYELVNYKLLNQLHKEDIVSEQYYSTDAISERDYVKAYLKLLS